MFLLGLIRRVIQNIQSGITFNHSALKRLPAFYPSSSNIWKNPELGFQSANNFPRQLLQLMRVLEEIGNSSKAIKTPSALSSRNRFGEDFTPIPMSKISGSAEIPTQEIRESFQLYGCSKLPFSEVYSYMLGKISGQVDVPRILEIGIGTNKAGIVSAMDKDYQPGASLRSYKALIQSAQIFGVDYDKSCLFSEDRIVTAFGDQTKPESLNELISSFGGGFDLVIDDGLHTTEANLNTLIFGLKATKPTGVIYIEDIPIGSIEVWQLVSSVMHKYGYSTRIIQQDPWGLSFLVEKSYTEIGF
jgi:hypothetical protein